MGVRGPDPRRLTPALLRRPAPGPRCRRGRVAVRGSPADADSELNTRDPDGAKAFYGAVFGWAASSLEMEGGDVGMWRGPGYGDFLAQRDPGLDRRLADVGAPEGFEDAVAWLVPMTSDRVPDDTPPHWSVTFAVDDADAIADRAAKLGGKVLVPPVDAPWVRTAVLSDPQGAVFTASKFTPPT